jgi:hypothetical protein
VTINAEGHFTGINTKLPNYRNWIRTYDLCAYCGKRPATPYTGKQGLQDTFTLDHVIAASKGGGEQNNLVACCRQCNHEKKDTPLLHFLLERSHRSGKQVAQCQCHNCVTKRREASKQQNTRLTYNLDRISITR